MSVFIQYRALHIAVVQGELAMVYKLIELLLLARRSLDIYNNLRQVRQSMLYTHVTFLSVKENMHSHTAAIVTFTSAEFK